jgi:hypothetical protein
VKQFTIYGVTLKRAITFLLVSTFLLTACSHVTAATATATPLLEESPAITPVIEGTFLNECRNCHTDKQRLIDTAMPEVVIEKESTGAG